MGRHGDNIPEQREAGEEALSFLPAGSRGFQEAAVEIDGRFIVSGIGQGLDKLLEEIEKILSSSLKKVI